LDHKTDIDRKVPIETDLDGSPDICFGPTASAGLNNGCLPTVPDKGGWIPLLLDNPLHPMLDRTFRPSEIHPI
jgi:hypothetical protein